MLGRLSTNLRSRAFDIWYEYATSRNSAIIDDFDGIHDDLLPFWSLAPDDIRRRTWEMTCNPWNEISGISIRNGKVNLGANKVPTHRWMLEGVAALLEPFVQHIPDMDLALNLNDESRVAVEWQLLQDMRASSLRNATSNAKVQSSWSQNRSSQWRDVGDSPTAQTRFEDHSFANSYYMYAAKTCPPESKARNERIWNTRDLCASCAAPHSLGVFVSNWTGAADACHQPDLANLHGFFLSPAAFKTTRELMPVFSQSKVHRYNDIL